MSSDNKAVIVRWFDEVWTQGRTEAIDEMLAAHGVVHGLGPAPQNRDQFKQFHAAYRDAFPDVTLSVDDLVA